MESTGQMTPAEATEHIRRAISSECCDLCWTGHAREQLALRDLTMGDVKHVLKRGFVYEPGIPATKLGFFKFRIEGTTPNSNGRSVRAVVIPSNGCYLKLVTVMWVDETS